LKYSLTPACGRQVVYMLYFSQAFELEYLTKDAFENISKKAKKLAAKMSNYIASIKESNI
jgi:hypothetical protein